MKRKPYATGSTVTIRQSKQEILHLLEATDVTDYAFRAAPDGKSTQLAFVLQGRHLLFQVPKPDPGRFPTVASREAEERRRWRVLVLKLKASFEVIWGDDGTVESEFAANLILPEGDTLGERLATRQLPAGLLALPEASP